MIARTVSEAKAQLSALVEKVVQGEEVILSRSGRPVAILTRFDAARRPRTPGSLRGKVRIHDDFDSLPPDVAAAFGMEEP
jgi:prevent-host-death family protein